MEFTIRLPTLLLTLVVPTVLCAQPKNGLPHAWPPEVGKAYPDLVLKNQAGEVVRLSELKGKVIIVEPIGMGCPACQAFAGGNTKLGPYGRGQPQRGILSFEELLAQFAKVKPNDKSLVYVQLLLYDMSNRKAPTVDDARKWDEHFGVTKMKNARVLVGDARYINRASYNLIPRFQLIDKNFVLRSDSSGHQPRDDLYKTLLRMVKGLLGTRPKRSAKPRRDVPAKAKPKARAEPKEGASDPKALKLLRSARNYAANGLKAKALMKVDAALARTLSDADRSEAQALREELMGY